MSKQNTKNIFIEKAMLIHGSKYDGIQHFKPVNYFGGLIAFECQKIRDKKKDEYCIKNNIHLLRISHIEDVNDKLDFI